MANITWGTATNIAGDTDAIATGTLKYAYNWSGSDATLNGTLFKGTTVYSGSVDSGQLTMGGIFARQTYGTNAFIVGSGLYASLSSAYQVVIGGGATGNYGGTNAGTVVLNNLTVGHSYSVELWGSNTYYDGPTHQTLDDGNGHSVTTILQTTNGLGYCGQYVVGTFTANATTQLINITP